MYPLYNRFNNKVAFQAFDWIISDISLFSPAYESQEHKYKHKYILLVTKMRSYMHKLFLELLHVYFINNDATHNELM